MLPKTLRVFEHQTLRAGEALRAADGTSVTLEARHVEALARFNDAHRQEFFGVGHRQVRLRHYVGFVEVGDLAIEILPKADRAGASSGASTARWHRALLEMLRVATGLRLLSPGAADQTLARSSLIELVAARFVEEVERLLHEGLAKGYRAEEANGPTFRGRLLVAENIRANLVRADRFFVRFATWDRDILPNRVLATALAVVPELPVSIGVRARASVCAARFPDLAPLRVTPATFERLPRGRSTARYRDALIFARMILEQQVPELRAGRTPVFALLFDMNLLWERYIAALFRRARGAGIAVSTQEGRAFWKVPGSPARSVRPDIVVRRGAEVALIADTKWKLLDDSAPSDADLQQMFVYNELFAAPRAVLIYPASGGAPRRGRYADRDHACEAVELGVFGEKGIDTAATQREVEGLVDAQEPARHAATAAQP
jgi:5-methylcytosine-specific restriction enzyme subunit McrC